MARIPETVVVRRRSGPAVSAVLIRVRERDVLGDDVDVWADEVGGDPIPFEDRRTDELGRFTFWREVVEVNVEIQAPGAPIVTIPVGTEAAAGGGGIDPAVIENAGDLIIGTGAGTVDNLPTAGSAEGDVLTRDDGAPQGVAWLPPAGGGGGIDPAIIDAVGDLIVGSGPDAVDNLPVGAAADGHVLTRDAAAPLGMVWAAAAAGGGGVELGLHADRPAAAPGNAGTTYYSTDRGIAYVSTGAGWLPLNDGVLVLDADQGPLADNTLVESPDLRFPLFEGERFQWQLWLAVEGTSVTPDIRMNFAPPATFHGSGAAGIRWQQALAQFGVSQTTDPGALTAGSPITGLGPGIKGTSYVGWLFGDQLVAPGDEAIVTYGQQTTTPANPITVRAGSCLILRDLTRP